jgi:adenylate cyclase
VQVEEEEGIAQMRQGLSGLQATGAELVRPYIFAKLAEAYGAGGHPEEGLASLAEALTVAYKTGERWSEAEVYRLRGQLMLQKFHGSDSRMQAPDFQHATSSPHTEAEACFQKAIDIARQQQAKSWELRASTSLARLWQQQGKQREAHQMLAEVYNWFTEGFGTKDLQEAKALLEALHEKSQSAPQRTPLPVSFSTPIAKTSVTQGTGKWNGTLEALPAPF